MARRLPDLELTVEEVNPEIAEEWLQANTKNRKRSDRLVDNYAEMMRNKEWVLNGEPIIFDKNGVLQSGQHRLWAIIESGATIWTVVVRGADPIGLYTLDTGRKRSLADALTLRGEKNAGTLGTAILYRWRYDNHQMAGSRHSPSVAHLLDYFDKHQTLREDVRVGYRVTPAIRMSSGMYSALYNVFSGLDQTNADQFTEMLISGLDLDGSGLNGDHPVYILRRWTHRAQISTVRPPVPAYAAVTVKAWNAWREHRFIRQVSWRAEEEFPEAL